MKYSECIDWELGIDHQVVLIDRRRRSDEKHDREKEKYYHVLYSVLGILWLSAHVAA